MGNAAHDLQNDNQKVHADANKAKTDLSKGTHAIVSKGDEKIPMPHIASEDARKTIFTKMDALRKQEMELRKQEQVADPVADKPEPKTVADEVLGIPPADPVVVPVDPGLAIEPEYVNLVFQGRPIKVSRKDIERAGGESSYIRARENEAEAENLIRERAELDQVKSGLQVTIEEARRLQAEIQRPPAATHDVSANSLSGAAQGVSPTPGASDADIDTKANELASMLYSGDLEDAAKALKEILLQSNQNKVNTDEVVNRALERIKSVNAQAGEPEPSQYQEPPAPTADPVHERMFARINTMADQEFADVVNDPVQRAAALALLQTMSVQPVNVDRDAVDIARDACEAISMQFNHPRRKVVEEKRGLPPVPSASGMAPAPVEEKPMTPKEYVAALAARRNFGPKTRP